MCCRSTLNRVSPPLPCYFSKNPLKEEFLDIYLTTFFGVDKFKNTSAMRVIFFLKIFKIESKFTKCKLLRSIVSVKKRTLIISSPWVKKQS